jgi:hypothetical protein
MYKAIYDEKKTYSKYDDTHYVCYLNEEREAIPAVAGMGTDQGVAEPGPEPSLGYAYTGNLPDGGTLIEAGEATYAAFVSGLIRVEYPQSRVEAIQANRMTAFLDPKHERAAGYAAEWDAYQFYREWCKEQSGNLMGVETVPVPEAVRTVADAVGDKLAALEAYDNSPEVNSFFLSGMSCWITADERAWYNTSIESAKTLGEETITVPIGGQFVTLPIDTAKWVLALIQRYADNAASTTIAHKAAIGTLTTIEEVDAYDFTTGYPEKITIPLPE